MKQHILVATAALALCSAPAFADDARTPPPSEPYFAPETNSCDLVQLKVYFEPGTADLTSFARDAIREAGAQMSGCAVTGLSVVAIAGDMQGEGPSVSLAQDRRTKVIDELQAYGIGTSSPAMALDLEKSIMSRSVDIELTTVPASFG